MVESLRKAHPGNKRWLEVLKHVVVWLIIFALPYLVRYNYSDHFRREPAITRFFYIDTLLKLPWVIIFYLNAFLLAPLFIYRKKYVVYGLVITVIFCAVALLHEGIMRMMEHNRVFFFKGRVSVTQPLPAIAPMPSLHIDSARDVVGFTTDGSGRRMFIRHRQPFSFFGAITFNIVPYCLTIVASILFRMMRDRSRADILAQQKQEENLKTELSFLRSQISPHFLFNILNNITALARKKSDELEPTVIKLSSLMRYMLYEANEEKVPLKTEVEYLESYIELQRQRFGDKVDISVQMENTTGQMALIEPMLLIPFVENAFKHGVGLIHKPQIDILLKVSGSELIFIVSNKFTEETEEKDSATGIGLSNVRRRLNLLYGKAHELEIRKETDAEQNTWFHVTLHLKLH